MPIFSEFVFATVILSAESNKADDFCSNRKLNFSIELKFVEWHSIPIMAVVNELGL